VAVGLGIGTGWFLRPVSGPDVTQPANPTAELAADAPAVADRSIAVLPFVNMSADPEQEYFSDGLSEEILNLLAQIRDLRVIGRTSSFAFKGRNEDLRTIGSTLGVAYLLEGSVRKAGDDLRITAQLIEVEGGSHLWSQSYDRRLENVFAIQTEIAGSIAEALRISLVGPDQAAPVAQAVLLLVGEVLDYGDIPLDQAAAMAQPLIDRALERTQASRDNSSRALPHLVTTTLRSN
jgi:TolB-like protein